MQKENVYDCIIIGAGPGGLQAAIYLGRYNRNVLLIDRGGGRTFHAKHIANFLTHEMISGKKIVETGLGQAGNFNVRIEKGRVERVLKKENFEVYMRDDRHYARFVIVSSGGYDDLPAIENMQKFLGAGFFTCVDCDGYETTGKKLAVLGNSIHTVRLAFAMKEVFTKDVRLILLSYEPPEDFKRELENAGISLLKGIPLRIIGVELIEALELEGGSRVECEVIMADFDLKLNDDFLSEVPLKRDSRNYKYETNRNYESSVGGLYIVGPLNTGNDQAIIAAGEGAVAAIDIKNRLLEI